MQDSQKIFTFINLDKDILRSEKLNQDYRSQRLLSSSASEAIESPALPLESVHHVHGSHSLALGVLGVGHSVTDDILQEDLWESCIILNWIQ